MKKHRTATIKRHTNYGFDMVRGTGIFTAVIQAVIIVIPVWASIAVFLVNKSPLRGDRFAIFSGSILTVTTWQIIRIMNVITRQIHEITVGALAEEAAPRGSPLYSSTEIILRLDELLIGFWFLTITLLYFSVSDKITDLIRSVYYDEELKVMTLLGRRISVSTRKKAVSVVGYVLWFGIVLIFSIIVAWVGGKAVT